MSNSTKGCKVEQLYKDTTFCDVINNKCFVGVELGISEFNDDICRSMPCEYCEKARRDALKLKGARFGKHDRRVLLEAALFEDKNGAILEPENETRSASEALRRSIHKLEDIGLVIVGKDEQDSRRKKRYGYYMGFEYVMPTGTTRFRAIRTTAKLTPLGELLREHVDLTDKIRWGDKPEQLAEKVVKTLPGLIGVFADNSKKWLEVNHFMFALMSRFSKNQKRINDNADHIKTLESAHKKALVWIEKRRAALDG